MSKPGLPDCEKSTQEDQSSNAVASEGERSFRQVSGQYSDEGESSSSSEDEEGRSSLPPNKRRKYNEKMSDQRIDNLTNQVNYISSYLTQLPHYISAMSQHNTPNLAIPGPSNLEQQPGSQTQYLVNPSEVKDKLQLGDLHTDFDPNRVIPPAKKERLEEVNNLQHFESQAWKGIRYKNLLQSYSASPGFVSLKVNEELCHFNKKKDFLVTSDNFLAGLTNAHLEQRELLRQGLQDLVNWAATNPKELNPSSLFDKVSGFLGPNSLLHKSAEKIMQIICGRRSECIEIRRERILKEVNNSNLKVTLRNIPPSSEHLFNREVLMPVIQSLGGAHTWLNTPSYLKEGTNTHNQSNQPSRSNYKQNKRSQTSYNNNPRSERKQNQNNFRSSNNRNNFRNKRFKDDTNLNRKQK